MTAELIVPNFGDVRFLGVESKPTMIIVELHVGNGEVSRFILPAGELVRLGLLCYVHGYQHLSENEDDETCIDPPTSLH